MSSEERMIKKFKRRFPVGSLIHYKDFDQTINPSEYVLKEVIGLIVGLNEKTLGVKILCNGTLIRKNVAWIMSRTKTIQRPYLKL